MGVRGLETFLEQKCPQACRKVSIKGLVDSYKRKNNTDTVLIVVDGSSCLRHLYDDLNWLLGGQLKEFVRRIQNFVNAFQCLGITLVFYFDGTSIQRKRPVWISRRSNDVDKVYEIFDQLRKNTFSAYDEKRLFLLPCGMGTLARYIFKYESNCDVRTSLGECDEEIAAFARANKCFAILGQDTDYVIFEGGEFYLSMKNLNLITMTTVCYDRSTFAQVLRIPLWHLPLLATLCGNDIVPSADLKDFHIREFQNQGPNHGGRSQQYVPYSKLFHVVANYIRRKHLDKELQPHTLAAISWDAFRTESRAALIESSLQSYMPQPEEPEEVSDTNWSKILSLGRKRHMCGEVTAMYPVMTDEPFEICTGLEDFRLLDLPAAASLLQTLRQRTYGILLKEKEGAGEVQEWCVDGRDEKKWEKQMSPVFPAKGLHPGLLALWSDDTELSDQRWELFVRSITPQLSAAALRDLPTRLVIPAAILAYLRTEIPAEGEPCLHDWELDAMAIQAVLLTTTDPSIIVVEPPYASRAIRLATIFMRSVSHMLLLLAACGFPIALQEAMPWLYFDGKLFHSTYKALMEPDAKPVAELCVNQAGESLYDEYVRLRAIV